MTYSYFDYKSSEAVNGVDLSKYTQTPYIDRIDATLAMAHSHHELIAQKGGRLYERSTTPEFAHERDWGFLTTFFNVTAQVFREYRTLALATRDYKNLHHTIHFFTHCAEKQNELAKENKGNTEYFKGIGVRTDLLIADRKVVKREMINSYLIAAAKTIILASLIIFAGSFVYETVLGVVISASVGVAGVAAVAGIKFANRHIAHNNRADFDTTTKDDAVQNQWVEKYKLNPALLIDDNQHNVEAFINWFQN